MHPLFLRRFCGVVGRFRTAWIAGHPALKFETCVSVHAIPIAAPLPNVSGHIVEAESIRCVLCHRGDPLKSILSRVPALHREFTLENIGLKFTIWLQLISPGIQLPSPATSRCKLPLRLRREAFTRPCGIGLGIRIGNLHDGIVLTPLEITFRSGRVPPLRTGKVTPPLEIIVQLHRLGRGREDRGTRD